MLETILKPISEDLENTNNILMKEFAYILKRTGNIAGLEYFLKSASLRPALVILSSRIYGGNTEKTAVLAAVMQLIYFASIVVDAISGEESSPGIKGSGQLSGDRFNVLLGDYFHSRASVIMQESGIKGTSRTLADIVCRMQEARIQKKIITGNNASDQVSPIIIQKESAELLAGCCMLGARIAGARMEEQEFMASYGRNIGMAICYSEMDGSPEQIAHYLDKAQKALLLIPDKPERAILGQLIKKVDKRGVKAQRLVG
ncbi:MAG: polyprenyl synthetase family protein [Peptococcaceae bacterium]|nr:polyprenyl synthetase family protein [Peptococcaceae bacterium]